MAVDEHSNVQVLRQSVQLRAEHPLPEEICTELMARLNGLPYVVETTWFPLIIDDDGDEMLEGVVKMQPMHELPDDIEDFYEAFRLPYISGGVQGWMPQTVGQQIDHSLTELERQQAEARIRADIARHEESTRRLWAENVALTEHIDPEKPFTEAQREVAVALNLILEVLARMERDSTEKRVVPVQDSSLLEQLDYTHTEGAEAGLRAAALTIHNELTRRQLPLVARSDAL